MKNFLFFTALFSAAASNNAQTQSSASEELEMQEFVCDFMAAYNQSDVATIQKMYTEFATRTDENGKEMVGSDQIAAFFTEQFRFNNATLLLRQRTINWSDYQRAWVARGTYEIYGKTIVYDIPVNVSGAYENTMVKQNGKWHIAKSVLTPLVKVMVYQKVDDFAEWKSRFAEARPFGLASGQLSEEFGTLHGQPNMAYMVSEWNSVESFQNFFDDPNFQKAMKEAGMTEKPTVMILNQK